MTLGLEHQSAFSADVALGSLAAAVEGIAKAVQALNVKMDRMDVAVVALARVEERNADHANAISRAFHKIEEEQKERRADVTLLKAAVETEKARITQLEKEGIKAKALVRGVMIGMGAVITTCAAVAYWAINTLLSHLPEILAKAPALAAAPGM